MGILAPAYIKQSLLMKLVGLQTFWSENAELSIDLLAMLPELLSVSISISTGLYV
jgi:hypothetical protein